MANQFDLRKFLNENKLTRAGRVLKENDAHAAHYDATLARIEDILQGSKLLKSYYMKPGELNVPQMEEFIRRNQGGTYLYWFDERGEFTGIEKVTPEQALGIVKAMETDGVMPNGVPGGYEGELHYVQGQVDPAKLAGIGNKQDLPRESASLNEGAVSLNDVVSQLQNAIDPANYTEMGLGSEEDILITMLENVQELTNNFLRNLQ